MTNVYLIGYPHAESAHVIKVGVSGDVSKRVAQIQSCNPEKINVYFALRFKDRWLACEIEQTFHKLFGHRCIRGEWYRMHWPHALMMLTFIVSRAVSSRFSGDAKRRVRAYAGLPRAFDVTDRITSDEQAALVDELDDAVASVGFVW